MQHRNHSNKGGQSSLRSKQNQGVVERDVRVQYGVLQGKIVVGWDRPIQTWMMTVDQVDEAVKFLRECQEVARRNGGETPQPS